MFFLIITMLFFYIFGLFLVYKRTNNLMNKLDISPSPEEAGILLKLILLYPFFYPEIEQFLLTCNKP